ERLDPLDALVDDGRQRIARRRTFDKRFSDGFGCGRWCGIPGRRRAQERLVRGRDFFDTWPRRGKLAATSARSNAACNWPFNSATCCCSSATTALSLARGGRPAGFVSKAVIAAWIAS